MKRALAWLAFVAVLGTALWAVTAWPRIEEVETGRTPEYPDLQVRRYDARPEKVGGAVREAIARLPRWTVVGSGEGPQGAFVSAVHETSVLGLEEDVTIRIRREGGRTVVSVRSRARVGPWDFGQNARNVREILAALDAGLR